MPTNISKSLPFGVVELMETLQEYHSLHALRIQVATLRGSGINGNL